MAQQPEVKAPSGLARYRFLGNSGLRVSPLCLGGMNFGDRWEFMGKVSKEEVFKILETYVSKGGNFIDTANAYHGGQSEEWLGEFMEKKGNRDDLVIATKYTAPTKEGVINSAGNCRKNMFQAVDASLKRLRTTYIDLYYVHFYDFKTPVEEVMRGLDDLVRSGKVHYVAVSDWPAWAVARANTLAELKSWTPFIAYQGRYHLGERDLEQDVHPMATELGLGLIPWAVLGQGKFTGKYKKGEKPEDAKRMGVTMSDKDYAIADEVCKIAQEIKRSAAQVALNWVLQRPERPTALIGCRTVAQLEDNLGALEFTLSKEHLQRLDDASKYELLFPHKFIGTSYQTNPWLKRGGVVDV